ncbi:cytochrome c oxidase assembly protein [Methylorubrum zatmanii]|uniref:Cytochrome c oxidase assembly protein CtaG n=1 Tax=Methylorubrum zatmanii TaxID=29429 RepID=A0ABW1WI67_9HYPH|nr:cytochrome c oxidase assembly protein [Methylorubrum zatmanii]MBD8905478.1 cytochrome c oxidase assembly protein [Methylorubrum zatmanii]
MMDAGERQRQVARGARRTVLVCVGVVLGMGGLAVASAPLYSLFCKATGFNGTPLVGAAPTASAGEVSAPLTVRFDTNVSKALSWRFQPEQSSVDAVPGQTATVFFKVTNTGSTPSTGIAVFNVQPELMGGYFVKVQCFCFDEHTLQPGESAEFPLVFYVDPALRKDPDIGDLSEMTLSYTYYPSKNGAPVAEAAKPRSTTNF